MVINDSQDEHLDTEHIHPSPNAGAGDPTDNRSQYQWATRYPRPAIIQIRLEALYLLLVFLFSFFLIFATWKGIINSLLFASPAQGITLTRYLYYAASGMLGGVAFGMKFFYRVVARGFWHQDRRIWRLMSPLIAMTLAFIIGAMSEASFIVLQKPIKSPAIISIGFLVGYFADEAIGKMYEIANVIFGRSTSTKAGDGK